MGKREKYLNLSHKVGLYIETDYHSICWREDLKSGHVPLLSFSSLTTRHGALKESVGGGKEKQRQLK